MSDIVVTRAGEGHVADWGEGPRPCAVGRAGIAVKVKEGDGVTPLGVYPLRRVLYRTDRMNVPDTKLELSSINTKDGWCDAPADSRYNQLVHLPYPASAEHLWREDHIYDCIVVVGYNDDPVTPGKGSAIFIHLAKEGFMPTEGCVALTREDLLAALKQLQPGDCLVVE